MFVDSVRWLYIQLRKLFPDEEIYEDYLHPDLKWANATHPESNSLSPSPSSSPSSISSSLNNIELDLWLPQFNLAFEYQG